MSKIVGAKLVSDATNNEILIGSPFKKIIFERIRAQKVLQEILEPKESPRRNSSPGKICTTVSKLFPKAVQNPYTAKETAPVKLRVSSLTTSQKLERSWRQFRIVKNKDTSHVRKNIEAVAGCSKPPKPPTARVSTPQGAPEQATKECKPRFEIKLKRTLSAGDLAAIVDAPEPEHIYTQEMTHMPANIIPFGSSSVLGLTSPHIGPQHHKASRSLCGLEAILEELPHSLALERAEGILPKPYKARGGIKVPLSRILKVVSRPPVRPIHIPQLDTRQIFTRTEQPTLADQRHGLLRETHRLAAL